MSLRLLLLSFIAAGLGFGADLSVFSISDLVGPSAHTALAASISNVGTSAAVTADVTFYCGSVIAGSFLTDLDGTTITADTLGTVVQVKDDNPPPASTPEPATLSLAAFGATFLAIGCYRRSAKRG